MEPGAAFVLFLAFCAAGMVLAAVLPDRRAPAVIAWVGSAASVVLIALGGEALLSTRAAVLALWSVRGVGALVVVVDRLSAVFLVVTGLVVLPVSVFSARYLPRYLGHYSLRAFGILYHALVAAIVLVLAGGDVLSFLLSWEAVAILSYLLVNYEHERDDVTQAGYVMLAMGEAGTLAAALALLILVVAGRSTDFGGLRQAASVLEPRGRWAVFLLSFFGFGVKAGLVPASTWLPRAHPVAPANVSALLSGLIVNLGVYGIVRVNLDFAPVPGVGPGLIVLGTGSLSALVGILYATTQNDMKTMLAHSTVENMGIVTADVGAGLVFGAAGHAALASVAYVVALYHLANHALYKGLLFLGAGTVDTRVGTRDMDRLGGLIHRMPWTALFGLAGALSIAAMPPFNGFVSEWLTLQTMLRSVELASTPVKIVFALCGAALALTSALAVTCFVKAFAMSFLGLPRSPAAAEAGEAPRAMTAAMAFLAIACLLFGVLPTYVISALDRAVAPIAHAGAAEALVPPFFAPAAAPRSLPPAFVAEFHDLGAQVGAGVVPGPGLVVLHRGGVPNPVVFAMSTSYMVVVLALLLGVAYATVRLVARRPRVTRGAPWAGGLPRLLPEMTYTAAGFSNPVRVIFGAVFHPSAPEDEIETVAERWRAVVRRAHAEVYVVDRIFYGPVVRGARWIAEVLARMHHGLINTYAAYVLITLLVFLMLGRAL